MDTAQTQKVGNTCIIVENVNCELKLQIRHSNVLIPCLKFGIFSKIVWIGYLLKNSKKAIIQHWDPSNSTLVGVRPNRLEVPWYGGTNDGLVGVRGNMFRWAQQWEKVWHSTILVKADHTDKTPLEISKMVLAEQWDEKQRNKLYQLLGVEHGTEI